MLQVVEDVLGGGRDDEAHLVSLMEANTEPVECSLHCLDSYIGIGGESEGAGLSRQAFGQAAPVRVIAANDGGATGSKIALEDHAFDGKVAFHVSMKIEMIPTQVCKHRTGELASFQPAQRNAMRGGFQYTVTTPCLYGTG